MKEGFNIRKKIEIEGAIFDVDGTIIDSMPLWHNCGEKYLNSIGITPKENLGDILFEMTLEKGIDYIIKEYKLEKTKEEIYKEIGDIVEDFYINRSKLKSGVKEILEYFKNRNVKMVIATSTERKYIEKAFKRLDILKYFDKIFTCDEVGKCKSEPDIFFEALKYLETPKNKTWVFEDALYSIKTIKEMGLKVFGIYDEISRKYQKEIKNISDIYLISLEDIFKYI